MKRGQVFVRGRDAQGKWGSIDVLDLDDESFRAFILEMLYRGGYVVGIKDEHVDGEPIIYRARTTQEKANVQDHD